MQAGLSQVKFAISLGLGDVQYLSNIERGMCGLPVRKIYQVARALGINYKEIIGIMIADQEEYLHFLASNAELDKVTSEILA